MTTEQHTRTTVSSKEESLSNTSEMISRLLRTKSEWQKQGKPPLDLDKSTLRCATLNVRSFLGQTSSSVHIDSSDIIGEVMTCAQIGILAVQEAGLSRGRLSNTQRHLRGHGIQIIDGRQHPQYDTIFLLVNDWWYARHTNIWRHPSGRALIVDFAIKKGVVLRVGAIYGYSGAEAHIEKGQLMRILLREFRIKLACNLKPQDGLIILGDFNLAWADSNSVTCSTILQEWVQALDLVHTWDAWHTNQCIERQDIYTHVQPTVNQGSAYSWIDHIWCAEIARMSVTAVGVSKHSFLESDHCLLYSDIRLDLITDQTTFQQRRFETRQQWTRQPFPRIEGWTDSTWAKWEQYLLGEADHFTKICDDIDSIVVDDLILASYEGGESVRTAYDKLWKAMTERLLKVASYVNTTQRQTGHKPFMPTHRVWLQQCQAKRLIEDYKRVHISDSHILSEKQAKWLERRAEYLGVELPDAGPSPVTWPQIIGVITAHWKATKKQLYKQRTQETTQQIDRVIKRRTQAYLSGRTGDLFRSVHRLMADPNQARQGAVWVTSEEGEAVVLSTTEDIKHHSKQVFQKQTRFSSSTWGPENFQQEQNLISNLLHAQKTILTQQTIREKLPAGLQSEFKRQLPAERFAHVLPEWTVAEFQQCVHRMKPKSAAGPTGAQYIHLSHLPFCVQKVFVSWFNHIQRSGIWPTAWKHAMIYPIPKGGTIGNLEDMRPISLVETVVKIFTRRLLGHLEAVLTSTTCIHPMQHGFLRG